MDYTTQMDAARKGILTGQLRAVAVEEKMEAERLRELVAKGQAVIPAIKITSASSPGGLGRALRTKINVNLGVSRDCLDLDEEFKRWRRPLPWAQRRSWIELLRRHKGIPSKACVRLHGGAGHGANL